MVGENVINVPVDRGAAAVTNNSLALRFQLALTA